MEILFGVPSLYGDIDSDDGCIVVFYMVLYSDADWRVSILLVSACCWLPVMRTQADAARPWRKWSFKDVGACYVRLC